MKNQVKKWEIQKRKSIKPEKGIKSIDRTINLLLENRGIKNNNEKLEFLMPKDPKDLELEELGLERKPIQRSLIRIQKAIKDNEQIIIYGDYDADGVCATAIIWETLYALTKNVNPYIPDRFSEGYGINSESVASLKIQYPGLKLIITVDNGIVANDAIKKAGELGIDVIITDHHQKGKVLPFAYSLIHTVKLSGSGIAWILAREINKFFTSDRLFLDNTLELAAIGTIADQLPLIGPNRSMVKFGLDRLNKTKRPGLLALFEQAGLNKVRNIVFGTYEVNYIIAPRLNAMGRMTHAIDSLRLLCTTSKIRAKELALHLAKINKERQSVVDKVLIHTLDNVKAKINKGVIIIAGEYHEGVIGLAAGKLVEEYYRPAIVISKGKQYSKASARSVSGFNIINAIRKVEYLLEGAGGHAMAAGFKIKNENLKKFSREFTKLSTKLLTDKVLLRKLKIDMEIGFDDITIELLKKLKDFEPCGIGNPAPLFMTSNVKVSNARTVGSDGKHIKLKLESGGFFVNAIAFNFGELSHKLISARGIDIAYNVTEDVWNGNKSLQLKIKDIHFSIE